MGVGDAEQRVLLGCLADRGEGLFGTGGKIVQVDSMALEGILYRPSGLKDSCLPLPRPVGVSGAELVGKGKLGLDAF